MDRHLILAAMAGELTGACNITQHIWIAGRIIAGNDAQD